MFSTKKVGILLTGNFFGIIFFKKDHEKFSEKVYFYSSVSLAGSGSGFRIRIRIQPGDLNPDPRGSGTLANSGQKSTKIEAAGGTLQYSSVSRNCITVKPKMYTCMRYGMAKSMILCFQASSKHGTGHCL